MAGKVIRDYVPGVNDFLHFTEVMNKNAAIGFEAANHYYFSKGQLAEKIVSCQYLIDLYNRQLSE